MRKCNWYLRNAGEHTGWKIGTENKEWFDIQLWPTMSKRIRQNLWFVFWQLTGQSKRQIQAVFRPRHFEYNQWYMTKDNSIGWTVHMMMSCQLLRFLKNGIQALQHPRKKCLRWKEDLKNKPHLVSFHKTILVFYYFFSWLWYNPIDPKMYLMKKKKI